MHIQGIRAKTIAVIIVFPRYLGNAQIFFHRMLHRDAVLIRAFRRHLVSIGRKLIEIGFQSVGHPLSRFHLRKIGHGGGPRLIGHGYHL